MIKKTVSIFLCLVIAALCCVSGFAAEPVTPVIIVTGMNSIPLIYAAGTEDEAVAFPPQSSLITAAIKSAILPTVKTMFTRDWNSFCDEVIPHVNSIFSLAECNPDGTSKHPVTTETVSGSYAENTNQNFVDEAGRDLGKRLVDELGAENVYLFLYDWRLDLYETAQSLNAFVEEVKADQGCAKVDFVSFSMGGVVTSCYLSQFGGSSLENVTLLSPAFTGLSMLGDVFTGNIQINRDALYRILSQLMSNQSPQLSLLFNILFKAIDITGALNFLFDFADECVAQTKTRVFEETFKQSFCSMPGMWELIPADSYQAAKQFIYGSGEQPQMIEKTDRYFSLVGSRIEEIYRSAIERDGVKFAIVSCYGRQSAPVCKCCDNQSDGTIDSVNTSGGATFAKLGTTLGRKYVQAVDCDHNHISPDRVVDASTAMFPECTWFVKNFEHYNYEYEGNSTDFIVWLTMADSQQSVFSNAEYPQFMVYSYKTHRLSALKACSLTSAFI